MCMSVCVHAVYVCVCMLCMCVCACCVCVCVHAVYVCVVPPICALNGAKNMKCYK